MERLRGQVLPPVQQQAPIGLPPNGGCIRCGTCDGYPCQIDAKADAEMSTVRPALATGHLTLRKSTLVRKLLLGRDGKTISGVEVEHDGTTEVLTAKIYVLSASAINSAALLLRSATPAMPRGLANSSDQVGRNYMTHNNSAMMAIGAWKNSTVFQKTVTINDYYFGDDEFRWPMGCLMSLGKLRAGVMTAANPLIPHFVNALLVERSFDWWILSEDPPTPENRITVAGTTIKMDVRRNNLRAHQELTKRATRAMRKAGLPLVLTKLMPVATTSHQCGTVRFGTDPSTSALDPFCRSWDHRNLFVVDASFFPSSAAVNPALTIAAQALRTAAHISKEEFGIF